MFPETSTYAFWAHEWTKHGTCAAVLEKLNSEFKYFSKGLEWFHRFDLSHVLRSHGVDPSNDKDYLLADLFHIFNNYLSVTPMIECRREHGKNWLSEIRFCFNKNFNLVNCDGVMNVRPQTLELQNGFYIRALTNCNIDERIMYPVSDVVFPTKEYVPSVYVPFYLLISWLQWFTM